MKIYKKLRLVLKISVLFCFFCVFFFSVNANGQDLLQVVESVPSETSLEISTLPRAENVWLDMVNSAKTCINIEMFYFSNEAGSSLEKIISAIKDAATRDVLIRVIVDSSFAAKNEYGAKELENIKNIETRKIPVGNISGGVMHAKYFVVDNEDVFVGSQNFDWRALTHIHEMGIRIKNKLFAASFNEIFEIDWQLCKVHNENSIPDIKYKTVDNAVNSANAVSFNTENFGYVTLYPAFSPYDITPEVFSFEEVEILKLLKKAVSSINIQIYSFSGKIPREKTRFDKIKKSLIAASKRGVKIRLTIPDWAMKKETVDFLSGISKYKNIEIKVLSYPEHSSGFIPYARVDHSKYFTVDGDYSYISTSNWEYDYFYKSRNASVVINNSGVNEVLKGSFARVWGSEYAETFDPDYDYKPPKRN